MEPEGIINQLHDLFVAYINVCKKLSGILWDSAGPAELLKPNARFQNFISQFENSDEFEELWKAVSNLDPNSPELSDIGTEFYDNYHDYKSQITGCLHNFFENTGIYNIIISNREFDTKQSFELFLNALRQDKIEDLRYAEVFPLKVELKGKESLSLGFDDFNLAKDFNRHNVFDETETGFIFLVQRRSYKQQNLGVLLRPMTVEALTSKYPLFREDESPFCFPLFILNLYFEKPLFIPSWYESRSSILYYGFQPLRHSSALASSAKNKFHEDYLKYLNDKYRDEAQEFASEEGYFDPERYDEFIFDKGEEFEKEDTFKSLINYLPDDEIERFKEFSSKASGFLKSDSFKESRWLQIAAHYFLMAHEKPDVADNLVNYVTALEALYFAKETSELKERLSNRIANLIGKSKEAKCALREKMLAVYKARCKYVHGADHQLPELNDYWLRNLLRLSLLAFLGLSRNWGKGKKREELLEKLDAVFDSSSIECLQKENADFWSLARPYSL